jgi:hypothetical protein
VVDNSTTTATTAVAVVAVILVIFGHCKSMVALVLLVAGIRLGHGFYCVAFSCGHGVVLLVFCTVGLGLTTTDGDVDLSHESVEPASLRGDCFSMNLPDRDVATTRCMDWLQCTSRKNEWLAIWTPSKTMVVRKR